MIDGWWFMIDDWWLMIDEWWLMIDEWLIMMISLWGKQWLHNLPRRALWHLRWCSFWAPRRAIDYSFHLRSMHSWTIDRLIDLCWIDLNNARWFLRYVWWEEDRSIDHVEVCDKFDKILVSKTLNLAPKTRNVTSKRLTLASKTRTLLLLPPWSMLDDLNNARWCLRDVWWDVVS